MRAVPGLVWTCAIACTLAACIPETLVACGDGRLCPSGTVCDAVHVTCVTPAQASVCTNEADGALCDAAGLAGICDRAVCLPGCGDGVQNLGEECDDGNYASHDGCSSACAREEPSWQRWVSPWRPRVGHSTAYHEAAGLLVVFGGHDGTKLLDEQWQRSATGWARFTGAQPPPRRNAAMAYDSARARIVLFGGVDKDGKPLGDTWELDGTTWTQRSPVTSPPPRSEMAMVFDTQRNRMVLFGGAGDVSYSDTWEYDGSAWTPIVGPGPAIRSGHAMAWDPARHVALMFGGTYGFVTYSDTWQYDAGTWTRVENGTPDGRRGLMMAYSTTVGAMVMYGGRLGPTNGADTYEFGPLGWAQVTTGADAPPSRFGGTLTLDPTDGSAVLIGGSNGAAESLDDVWSFDGTWTERGADISPNARVAPLVYDDAHATLALISGLNSNDTDYWQFDGANWRREPSTVGGGFYQAMGYDPLRDRVVVFGGFGMNFALTNATSIRDGATGTWSTITAGTLPQAREMAALAYEPTAGTMALFGGEALGAALSDTWELGDTGWTHTLVEPHPPGDMMPVLTSDPLAGRVLLWETTGETWTFSNHVWSQLTVSASPPPRVGAGLAFDTARGHAVLYGGYEDANARDIWELHGDRWEPVTIAGARPQPRSNAGFSYDRRRHAFVLHAGYSASGTFDDTWLLQYRSPTPDEDCSNETDDDGDHQIDAADPDCN